MSSKRNKGNHDMNEYKIYDVDEAIKLLGRIFGDEPFTKYETVDMEPTYTYTYTAPNSIKFMDVLDDVKQVIYNEPATIVTFSDGSKVCVKCCEKDKFSKEAGLIYAIVKRLYANDIEKKSGYMKSTGLGEKLNKLINGALDQKEQERERRRKQKEKQAKKEAAKKAEMANEVSEKAAQEAVDQIYEDGK